MDWETHSETHARLRLYAAQPQLWSSSPTISLAFAPARVRRCYKCGGLGHLSFQCPKLTWEEYRRHRYKFGGNGELQEREEGEKLPGYGSADEAPKKTQTAAAAAGGPRPPRLPRGARAVAKRPRSGRPRPRPRPPMKLSKAKGKTKPKMTAKQLEKLRRDEERLAKLHAASKVEETDEESQRHWLEQQKNTTVEYRVCERTGKKVRTDMWDSYVSSLSTEVMEYMYLGGDRNANNHKELAYRTHVGFIVNAAWEVACRYPEEFEYLKLPVADFESESGALSRVLEPAMEFIDRARKCGSRVLVHCVAGISRSTTVCLAYLISREGWTLKRAYDYILKLRPVMRPNAGFFRELQELDRRCHGAVSMTTEEYELLEEGKVKVAHHELRSSATLKSQTM